MGMRWIHLKYYQYLSVILDGTSRQSRSVKSSKRSTGFGSACSPEIFGRLDMFLSSIVRSHGGQPRQSRQHKPCPTWLWHQVACLLIGLVLQTWGWLPIYSGRFTVGSCREDQEFHTDSWAEWGEEHIGMCRRDRALLPSNQIAVETWQRFWQWEARLAGILDNNAKSLEGGRRANEMRCKACKHSSAEAIYKPASTDVILDWSSVSHHKLGASSVDTTCTIWNLEKQKIETQLIAHDKAVYDIAFSHVDSLFASVGADGSVRVFDQRNLDHSTIIYESSPPSPLLRLAWNKINTNHIATIAMDAPGVNLIDIRRPSVALAALSYNDSCVNSITWAPHSRNHLLCGTDDGFGIVWDTAEAPAKLDSPLLAYDCGSEVYQAPMACIATRLCRTWHGPPSPSSSSLMNLMNVSVNVVSVLNFHDMCSWTVCKKCFTLLLYNRAARCISTGGCWHRSIVDYLCKLIRTIHVIWSLCVFKFQKHRIEERSKIWTSAIHEWLLAAQVNEGESLSGSFHICNFILS